MLIEYVNLICWCLIPNSMDSMLAVRLQAVRKLNAEIAWLKSAAAVAEQTAAQDSEETRMSHEKQLAAVKLASDLLQQQLANMAESVPAMLRSVATSGCTLPKAPLSVMLQLHNA